MWKFYSSHFEKIILENKFQIPYHRYLRSPYFPGILLLCPPSMPIILSSSYADLPSVLRTCLAILECMSLLHQPRMLPFFQLICSGNTYTPLQFESVDDTHLVLQVELIVLSVLFSFYPCGLFS